MDSRTIRLLVVEDNPAYLYLVQKAFGGRAEQTHWKVVSVEDGEQALRLLFEEEHDSLALPDLILLDWHLPKVSGSKVLRRMKEHETLRKIPILVFSASTLDEDIHEAYGNHANGYICKPDSPDALRAMVSKIEDFWVSAASIPKVVRQLKKASEAGSLKVRGFDSI